MLRSPPHQLLSLVPVLLLAGCVGVLREPEVECGCLLSRDRVRLAYEVRGCGSPAILFVHGGSGNRGQWEAAAEALSADHVVVTLDLAGHGESGVNRETWSLDAFADDVEAAVRQLHLRDVVLVGHSMGATVACIAAARLPDEVCAVIGVDALHTLQPPPVEALVADLERDYEGTFRRSIEASVGPNADPAVVERLVRDALATPREVALGVLSCYADLDLEAVLAATPVPVLCLNSEALRPTDVEANRAVKADFDVRPLEGVGHFPMVEDPDGFEQALRAALEHVVGDAPPVAS